MYKKKGKETMKVFSSILVAALLVGCVYEEPVFRKEDIPVDTEVLGLWKLTPDKGEEPSDERMVVMKFSDTEYLIHYPVGKDGVYYKGYPVRFEGISCVQLQAIGTSKGPIKKDEKKLFHVVSYRVEEGGIEVRLLNSDLIDDKLKTTEELREAFLKHKDHKELFVDPGKFRRLDKGT